MSQRCEECGRKVIYYSWKKKRLTAQSDHPLCSRCYRAERNRLGHRKGPVLFPVEIDQQQQGSA